MLHETIMIGEATLTSYVHHKSIECPHTPRPAMLVLPGGGYDFCYDGEAEPIALAYMRAGFNAYVLRYSCKEKAAYPRPLVEASMAMAYIRRKAAEHNTDPLRVFAIGFSAGGHLCGLLATRWHDPEIQALSGVTGEENRPTGAVLSYAVVSSSEVRHKGTFARISGKADPTDEERLPYSNDKNVSDKTPPCFLWHTADDTAVPVENSLLMAAALSAHKIPFTLHIFPAGGHGLCLATEETAKGMPGAIRRDAAEWLDLSLTWIRTYWPEK